MISKNFVVLALCMLAALPLSFAAINVALSDHGTGVRDKAGGELISSGNLTVLIYADSSGGAPVYNETFRNKIVNGSWNVMLGENSSNPLYLEFNRKYYKDYLINGEDASFTNLSGDTVDRQFFYSPMGEMGTKANTSGLYASALGYETAAKGIASHAFNYETISAGDYASAFGDNTLSTGYASVAMGSLTNATGDWSIAGGYNTLSSGAYSAAFGRYVIAGGQSAFAAGDECHADGGSSICLGELSNSTGKGSIALGSGVIAGGGESLATGFATRALGSQSTAVGSQTVAAGLHSISMGSYTKTSANDAFAWGGDNCDVPSTSCNNTRQGVFAIFGGLCVAGATDTCADVPDGDVYVNGSVVAEEVCINGDCRTDWPTSGAAGGWTEAGSVTSTTDSVGVGTDTPTTSLEVVGNATIDGSGLEYQQQYGILHVKPSPLWGSGIVVGDQSDNGRRTTISQGFITLYGVFSAGVDNMIRLDNAYDSWNMGLAYPDIYGNPTNFRFYVAENVSGIYVYRLVIQNKTGNVGIGTSTPDAKLDVNGTIRTNITSCSQALETDASGNIVCGTDATGGGSADGTGAWANTSTQTTTQVNVGIGSVLTGAKLYVNGTIKTNIASCTQALETDANGNIVCGTDATGGGSADGTGGWTNTSTQTTTNVSVGIGTAAPGAKLDVEVASGGAATIGSSGNSAPANYAIALGYNTTANNLYSLAAGAQTTSSGYAATAMGLNTTANGSVTTAFGWNTVASGAESTAIGDSTLASGWDSIAMGYDTLASGQVSTATGIETTASGDYSTSMGHETVASGQTSTAMGEEAVASGYEAISMGEQTVASGMTSIAMGVYSMATEQDSIAMGYWAKSSAIDAFAWGGDSCNNAASSCNNTRRGVFAVFGGLCVANASLSCPDVPDGSIVAGGPITGSAFDLAERMISSGQVEPGDVVIVDPDADERVIISSEAYDTRVAGIVSTDPGVVLGWEDTGNVKIALSGRVPVKATNENGDISPGDLLTTSSKRGYAMRCDVSTPENKLRCMGAILGKAMEPCGSDECKIVALVSLQ